MDPTINATRTGQEILAQPEAWAGALGAVAACSDRLQAVAADRPALFCGCGTSYYLAIAAARTYQQVTGLTARAVPASELFLAPEGILARGHQGPLIAISRSGETTETVRAARFYKEGGYGSVVSITARATSQLGQVGDVTVELPWADDQSVVMTRSFTTMLLACWAMAAAVAEDDAYRAELARLPALAATAIAEGLPLARQLGRDLEADRFVFLGLGAYLGFALEGMLKLKEMTEVDCEAYNPLEFRHGPISILHERTTAILLCSDAGADYYANLLADIAQLGARTVAVGQPQDGLGAHLSLPLGAGLTDRSRGLLYLPFLQLLGLERALALGFDPDKPRKLNRVVKL